MLEEDKRFKPVGDLMRCKSRKCNEDNILRYAYIIKYIKIIITSHNFIIYFFIILSILTQTQIFLTNRQRVAPTDKTANSGNEFGNTNACLDKYDTI